MHTITRILRSYITQLEVSYLEREDRCKEITQKLEKIEKNPKNIKEALNSMLEKEIGRGVEEARKHLRKTSVTDHLCHWEDSDCPSSDNLEQLDDLMFAHALKRIRNELNTWDKESGVFEGIQSRALEYLKEKFLSLEEELNQIEQEMATGDRELANMGTLLDKNRKAQSEKGASFKRGKSVPGFAGPILMPLGLIVGMLSLPVYGIKAAFKSRAQKKKLKEYRSNKGLEMKRVTKHLLDQVLGGEKLSNLMQEKIEATTSLIKQICSKIPNMIEADKHIVEKLRRQRNTDEELLLKTLHPLQHEALLLQGKIDLLYMTRIRTYDMTDRDLIDWRETDRPVAEGNFAKVFRATMITPGKYGSTRCALKMLKDAETQTLCPLTSMNATEALQEESSLR